MSGAFCVELIQGCAACEAENAYKQSVGHECGKSGQMFLTSCEVFGRMRRDYPQVHAQMHEPERCDNCCDILDDRQGNISYQRRLCKSGCCTYFYCPNCGTACTSYGPIGCPTCSSYGRWLVARPRVRRMHVSYHRRRKGHW